MRLHAVKEPPLVTARTFGREAIAAIKRGQWIRARDMAQTAAHFAQKHIEQTMRGDTQ